MNHLLSMIVALDELDRNLDDHIDFDDPPGRIAAETFFYLARAGSKIVRAAIQQEIERGD